jgi:hypothetical protein
MHAAGNTSFDMEGNMAAWYLAPSLSVLRGEVDTRWPRRDHTSDGTIGDEAHQSRESDHNPNSRGSVDAWDMDKDGVNVTEVIAAFQQHPSSHYWIWNRQIADRDTGWRRRPYSGDNPHTQHVHFSIRQTAAAEQNRQAWGLLEDTVTPAEFVKILDDPRVAARMRALPWQYSGGGIPTGMTTLGVLNAIYNAVTPVPADLVPRLDAILAAALDDNNPAVQFDEPTVAELRAIRDAVHGLPDKVSADVMDELSDVNDERAR